MPIYNFQMKRTASTTASMGNITAQAVTRRGCVWDLVYGCEGVAADNAFLFRAHRCTTTGTGTTVLPNPNDPADAACTGVARENHTIEPTYTASQELLEIAMNQRSTFRWQVDPTCGLIYPATASNGIGWLTPTAPALASTIQVFFNE